MAVESPVTVQSSGCSPSPVRSGRSHAEATTTCQQTFPELQTLRVSRCDQLPVHPQMQCQKPFNDFVPCVSVAHEEIFMTNLVPLAHDVHREPKTGNGWHSFLYSVPAQSQRKDENTFFYLTPDSRHGSVIKASQSHQQIKAASPTERANLFASRRW